MRIGIFKILVFIILLLISDRVAGILLRKMYFRSGDPAISKLRHTLDSTHEDVLIFGSSRAENHFIPNIISRNTGLNIYNCGIGGTDLQFSMIQLNESLKRYSPRCVILEVSPSPFFLLAENHKILLPFYDRDTLIYNLLTGDKPFEKLKFLSSTYPYNSTIASSLKGILKKKTDTLRGYIPVKGFFDTAGLYNSLNNTFSFSQLPTEKFAYLQQLMELCNRKKVKLVVVYSPMFQVNGNLEKMGNQIKLFCENKKGVYFLDYSKVSEIYGRADYFKDNTHLNYEGARRFSEIFSEKLRELFAKELLP